VFLGRLHHNLNQVGADMWINVPHMASDDYVTQLALYSKKHFHPLSTFMLSTVTKSGIGNSPKPRGISTKLWLKSRGVILKSWIMIRVIISGIGGIVGLHWDWWRFVKFLGRSGERLKEWEGFWLGKCAVRVGVCGECLWKSVKVVLFRP